MVYFPAIYGQKFYSHFRKIFFILNSSLVVLKRPTSYLVNIKVKCITKCLKTGKLAFVWQHHRTREMVERNPTTLNVHSLTYRCV